MKPHITATFGSTELLAEVVWDHLKDHHRVDPKTERPFVVSSTPILANSMGTLQMIQITILVHSEGE